MEPLNTGGQRGRERALAGIGAAAGGRFTIREIAQVADVSYATANRMIWELQRSGIIRCEHSKPNLRRDDCATFLLVGELPRAERNGRGRMWAGMRVMRTFGIHELCAVAQTQTNNTLKFVLALERAGFVRCAVP